MCRRYRKVSLWQVFLSLSASADPVWLKNREERRSCSGWLSGGVSLRVGGSSDGGVISTDCFELKEKVSFSQNRLKKMYNFYDLSTTAAENISGSVEMKPRLVGFMFAHVGFGSRFRFGSSLFCSDPVWASDGLTEKNCDHKLHGSEQALITRPPLPCLTAENPHLQFSLLSQCAL